MAGRAEPWYLWQKFAIWTWCCSCREALTENLSWGGGGLLGGGLQRGRTRSGAEELGEEVGWEVGLHRGGHIHELENLESRLGDGEVLHGRRSS